MTIRIKFSLVILFSIFISQNAYCWGFFAHKEINKFAIFMLPPEMFTFYKKNLQYISNNAVNPDKRRYIVKEEACRHFIDLDSYDDKSRLKLPIYWKKAVEKFTEDTLNKHGIVPWYIYLMKFKLTEAFKNKNEKDILKLSAEIGHYIADSNVPLHTTKNYNGQLTNQVGIHGFWESRLPELFIQDYDFFIGQAIYVSKVQETIWQGVYAAHAALDSVLTFESILNAKYPEDKKYSIEERNGINIKVYSIDYAKSYHDMLKNQIERQMIASITMVGNIWYTCWVDAGQPDLNSFKIKTEIDIKEKQEIINSSTDNCSH